MSGAEQKTALLAADGAGFKEINAAVEIAVAPYAVVDEGLIDRTIERARIAPHRRARVLLHTGPEDSLHEMLIALPRESCDIPHINFKSGKSFHVVRGDMAVMIFDADGSRVVPCCLGMAGALSGCMVRLNHPYWHTIIPLSDYVVFIETIIGPFTGNQFAPWAPVPNDADQWSAFAKSLRDIAADGIAGIPAIAKIKEAK